MAHGQALISVVRALIHGFPMKNEDIDMDYAFESESSTNILVNLTFLSAYTADDKPLEDVRREFFEQSGVTLVGPDTFRAVQVSRGASWPFGITFWTLRIQTRGGLLGPRASCAAFFVAPTPLVPGPKTRRFRSSPGRPCTLSSCLCWWPSASTASISASWGPFSSSGIS